MKRIIRGIVPPAKKMAKRSSGESAGKVDGDGAGCAMKIGNEDISTMCKNDLEGQQSLDDTNQSKNDPCSLEKSSNIVSKGDIKSNLLDISRKLSEESQDFQNDAGSTEQSKSPPVSKDIIQLPSPIKSQNDKMEYKVIKLPNGLTALLISDVKHIVELKPEDCTLENEEKVEAEATSGHSEEASDHPEATSGHSEEASDHPEATSGHSEESSDHPEATSGHSEEASDHPEATSGHSEEASDHPEATSGHSEEASDCPEATSGHSEEASDHETEEEYTDNESDFSSDSEEPAWKSLTEEEKLAAVALTVGVGSFSDPEEIPGLAHFLEHMVFMGSEKFPQENDFDEYVKKQGGFDNASTYCETTTFYFECHEERLLRTADRFAQFFISPLMKREAMTREREAIESEFQMSVTSDDDRKVQLFSSMAFGKHPATKFTWGNLKTLRDNITDDQLYEAVHNFRNRHYSAHRMTLAVQARLPLDLLEKWVTECFSAIPNNNLPPEDFTPFKGPAFEKQKFCQLYFVNPVRDVCQLDITWFLPPLVHLYRKKPLDYISWILVHEGRGSLHSHLRRKVWALEVLGDSTNDFEDNSLYRLYSLCIVLTKEGINHLPEVIEAVFAYLKLLRSKGPQEDLFKEIQSVEESSFRFLEEVPASEYVENLSDDMQMYPPEDYICGGNLYFEYDPAVISQCLSEFRLDNVNLMVSTKRPRGVTFDQTEPWFGTKYHAEPIPQDWIEKWSKVEPYPDFALPDKNPFITTDFSILPEEADTRDQLYPIKLVESKELELWYRRDYKFLVPYAFLYVYIVSPVSSVCVRQFVMMDIFRSLLEQQLTEELYPARMADLDYDWAATQRGLVIRCWGFNEKVPMLLETFIKGIKSFNDKLDENIFAAVKDKLQKHYYNYLLKPESVSIDVRAAILHHRHWTTVDKYKAIKQVTPDALKAFVSRLFERIYVQFLAQGNISKEGAIKISQKVKDILGGEALPIEEFVPNRVLQLPVGERVCRIRAFNKVDTNCVTTNYYQSGLGSIKDYSIIEMVMMLMDEPLFNILRTKEQLGYSVYCLPTETFGVIGFLIAVVSNSVKHTTEHVNERIEEFLKTFTKELTQMKTEDFNHVLESLIKLKNCADVHLQEEVDKNWAEIESQQYIFDRRKRAVEYLKDLKPSIVVKWLNDHTLCGNKSNVRKLSIQVVAEPRKEKGKGKGNGTSTIGLQDLKTSGNLSFEVLTEGDGGNNCFIKNMKDFRNDLYVFPAHKILS